MASQPPGRDGRPAETGPARGDSARADSARADPADPRPTKRCPICGKPAVDAAVAPFCSKRCADVDLHRWLGGVYAVPDDEPGSEDSGEA